MRMPRSASATRSTRATNVTLDAALVAEAKSLGVSISRSANEGLERAVRQARGGQWQEENRAALEAYNAYVAEHGLPLERYRRF